MNDVTESIVTEIAKYEAQKIGLPPNEKSIRFFSSLVDRSKILPMCQFLMDSPTRSAEQVVARFAAFYEDDSWLIEDESDTVRSSLSSTRLMDAAIEPLPHPQVAASPQSAATTTEQVTRVDVGASVSPAVGEKGVEQSRDLTSGQRQSQFTEYQDDSNSVYLATDSDSPEEFQDANETRVFDTREQKGPLPVTLDNHSQLIIGSGIFRTLNKNVINNPSLRPVLDSKIVYEVDPRFMNGYKAMTFAGPVLDSDFDIKTYLCLVRLLGSLNNTEYEKAAASTIELTPEQFYAPLAECLTPKEFDDYIKDFMRTDKILHSMKRLHAFQMTLYKQPDDVSQGKNNEKFKGSVMIVGLVSVIGLDGDGMIRITPNLPMREMYRAASRLIAVNRSTIIGFDYPISRIFGLWLTTVGKRQFKGGWVTIEQIMSVREILECIHPLTDTGEYYKKRHVQMLERALIELVGKGVLRCAYRKHNEKQFKQLTADNCSCFILEGLRVEINLICHRISHKQSPHQGEDQVQHVIDKHENKNILDDLETVPDTKISQELITKLKNIEFRRARFLSKSALLELYGSDLLDISAMLKHLQQVNADLCRKTMKSVLPYRRVRLAEYLLEVISESDKPVISEMCQTYWALEQEKQENRLLVILRAMPTEGKIKDLSDWVVVHRSLINEFLTLIESENGLALLKDVKTIMLNSRMINPLLKADLTKEANLIKYRKAIN